MVRKMGEVYEPVFMPLKGGNDYGHIKYFRYRENQGSQSCGSFINAIEESEKAKKTMPVVRLDSRMATREDSVRLYEMRKKQRKVSD